MSVENVEKIETGAFQPSESDVLFSIEVGAGGILRILIYSDGTGVAIDQQSAAHHLLAETMPQLMLLDSALKSVGAEVSEASK
jgi:hypothetical protein